RVEASRAIGVAGPPLQGRRVAARLPDQPLIMESARRRLARSPPTPSAIAYQIAALPITRKSEPPSDRCSSSLFFSTKENGCGRAWESRVLQRDFQAAVDAFCASTAASASTASSDLSDRARGA